MLWAHDKVKIGNRRIDSYLKFLFLASSFLVLYIPLAIRSVRVGTDYNRYKDVYLSLVSNEAIHVNIIKWLGWPFVSIVKISGMIIGQNYFLFYGILGFLTLLFFYKAILMSKKPWLSLFLFVSFCLYFQTFNQIRQMLSISLILFSYKYIASRELIKYVVLILSASVFHKTSLFFLPFYFLSKIKINKKSVTFYALIVVAVIALSFILRRAISLTSYGHFYSGSYLDLSMSKSSVLNLVVRLVMLFGTAVFYKNLIKRDQNNRILFNLIIWCVILQFATVFVSSLFGRMTTMFFVFYLLLIPEVVVVIEEKIKRHQKIIILLTLVAAFVYQTVYYFSKNGSVSGGYDKYETIFSERKTK